jgi:predicted glycosyltransferase
MGGRGGEGSTRGAGVTRVAANRGRRRGNRFLFFSHDGFGLGHARRNAVIAREVLTLDPSAHVVLLTGIGKRVAWLEDEGNVRVVRVPPLLKDSDGAYRNGTIPFAEAVARRGQALIEEVEADAPDVVVVDRHPFGTAGELREGLAGARRSGATLVLGLRDVLDEPTVVAQELASPAWQEAIELYDRVLVYGAALLVDHEAEYGLPTTPEYCGWVVTRPPPTKPEPRLLAVAAGGGGDGAEVFRLGSRLVELKSSWRGVIAAGPYSAPAAGLQPDAGGGRVRVLDGVPSCGALFSRAEAVLCMAGYNSTLEALAAGRRPILVPRRSPRREQAIRAGRLAALGLADVVDEGAHAEEVGWLLDRDRRLTPDRLREAGVCLDGARRAAQVLVELAAARNRQ